MNEMLACSSNVTLILLHCTILLYLMHTFQVKQHVCKFVNCQVIPHCDSLPELYCKNSDDRSVCYYLAYSPIGVYFS